MDQNALSSGSRLPGLGFSMSGFRPGGLGGAKLGATAWDIITAGWQGYIDLEKIKIEEEQAEALVKAEKIRLEQERLRLEQERLRQQGQRASAEGEIIPGVPNVVTFLGSAAVVGGVAWLAFGKTGKTGKTR